MTDRRSALKAAVTFTGLAAIPSLAQAATKLAPFAPHFGPRSRLIYVNDLSGDIDGLFATVHVLLSKTSSLRGIVGSAALMPGETSASSAALAKEILKLAGMSGQVPVYEGAGSRLGKSRTAQNSPGVQAIITEAMRTDTTLPLYIAVGGGLTEVASAVMHEPKVAERATLVWIGGGGWPNGGKGEYNFALDPDAAQFLFNDTQMPIWQVPEAVYRTCVVSATELEAFVAPRGKIGAWLYQKLVAYPQAISKSIPIKLNTGETWTLGDSPLAVLTSLADWVPNHSGRNLSYDRTSAGKYDEVICPTLNPDGSFMPRSEGRLIRIYKDIDTRLMFGDFFAKLAVNF